MSAAPALLITGGAKRAGAALARHFAQQGYDIALHYQHSETEARQLRDDIQAHGRACELLALDLRETSALPALVARACEALPRCHALVNNASIFERGEFLDTDEALFDRQFAVNFKAPFFLTQAFARHIKQGCVINILDTDITRTQGSHFAYLLSKKALADFTCMAARALGPRIRVNGICPGFLLPSADVHEQYGKTLAPTLPLKATATLNQVAMAAQWLVEQDGMTGQCLYTDGGQHLL